MYKVYDMEYDPMKLTYVATLSEAGLEAFIDAHVIDADDVQIQLEDSDVAYYEYWMIKRVGA